ncbi:S10 family peptidase [Phenylobacterium sp.]|uniref:S10 family peptidase n=1 Tax=Phenylobacterium sp. TaxID=1871053 RepID=UPI0035AF5407
MTRLLPAIAAALLSAGPAAAQAPPFELAVSAPRAEASAAPAPAPPRRFVTKHRTTIRGQRIDYTATAGETYLSSPGGEPIGSIFSFAYVKDGPRDPRRPVLFVFNGGPGSSSLWLHMGVVGPRRVALDREVNPSNVPPFGVADNPDSLLDVADLVFIDPVGTGFSRAVGSGRPEDFWGVDQDADSVAQFIELWLTENGRWGAPKFLMGESYGSVRAALLPRALMGGPTYLGVMRGITVNGIVLLGATFDGRDVPPKPERAFSAAADDFTAQAAVAWAHGRTAHQAKPLAAFQAEVNRFAATDYEDALRRSAAGALTSAERHALVARLSGYTGLPPTAYASDLKVSTGQFARQLLADKGLSVGLYDGRYTLPTAGSGGEPVADDPAMGRYVPGFIAAFHQMLHDDLKVDMGRPYGAIVWKDLLSKWKWTRAQTPPGQSFAVDLATAMRRNERLRVLVASGNYDLVTTPAAARRSLEAAQLPVGRVTFRDYPSGHMLYVGDTAAAFSDDVRALIRAAS